MKENRATNRTCPFTFIADLGNFLPCVTTLCMAWSTTGDDEGYCKRLNADSPGHVRYRPATGDEQMNESIALNRKCPYQFNNDLHEFNYCITSDCQAWQKESEADGYCQRLTKKECSCIKGELDK